LFLKEVINGKRQFMRINSEFFVWYQTIEEDEVSFGKTASKDVSAGVSD